jgi:hypothetical protein
VIKDIDLFDTSTAGSLVLAERFVKQNPSATRNLAEDFATTFERTRTLSREENECDPFGGTR